MIFIFTGLLLGILTILNILAPVSGSATVTPILTGLVGAKDAIAVASLFFVLSTIPRIFLFRKYIRWEIVKTLWPISIVGAIIGSIVLIYINGILVSLVILGFLIYFLLQKVQMSRTKKPIEPKKPTRHGVAFIGLSSGALQGSGLAGSDLRNGYLLSRGLSIPELHGTTAMIGGANFLFASISRIISGQLTWHMALPILALFPVIILATYIGRHLTVKLSKKWQDRFAIGVMIVALIILVVSLAKAFISYF